MSRIYLVLAALLGAILGGIVVGLFAGHISDQMAAMGSSALYDRDAYALDSNVKVLRALHQGDPDAATELLENDVTRGLELLSTYHDIVPQQDRHTEVYRTLDRARSYRAEVPRTYEVPGVRDAVSKALSLKQETGK